MSDLKEIFGDYQYEPAIEGVDYEETDVSWQSLGGQTSAEAKKERGENVYDPEWQAKHNPFLDPEWQKKNNPFLDPEWQKKHGFRGGTNNFTVECHKKGGVASTSIKYKCQQCDMISTVGGITSHIKSSGHIGYERLVNGNKTG